MVEKDENYKEGIKLKSYKCPECGKKQEEVIWCVQSRMNETIEYLLNIKTGLAKYRTWWNHDIAGDKFECPLCGVTLKGSLDEKLFWRKF